MSIRCRATEAYLHSNAHALKAKVYESFSTTLTATQFDAVSVKSTLMESFDSERLINDQKESRVQLKLSKLFKSIRIKYSWAARMIQLETRAVSRWMPSNALKRFSRSNLQVASHPFTDCSWGSRPLSRREHKRFRFHVSLIPVANFFDNFGFFG